MRDEKIECENRGMQLEKIGSSTEETGKVLRFFMNQGYKSKKTDISKIALMLLLLLTALFPAYADKSEKPYILYHSPEIEMMLSQALKNASLSVPIYKIGVEKLDGAKMAVIQFGVKKEISRSEIARNALEIISLCFAYDSRMRRVDVYGTDKPDVPDRKGEILFSVCAERRNFNMINFKLPSMKALEVLGLVYYSDEIYDIPARWIDFLKESNIPVPKEVKNKKPKKIK